MWAPKQRTLRDLPGLRQGRSSASTWDDSGFYTVPFMAGATRLSLNMLPTHAWNGGVKPRSSDNASTSANVATPHPKSRPVGSKETVTAARPTPGQSATVEISERVPNDLPVLVHAETARTTKPQGQGLVKMPQKSEVSNVAADKTPGKPYVPPHLRTSEPQSSEPGNVAGEKGATGSHIPPHLRSSEHKNSGLHNVTEDNAEIKSNVPPHLRTLEPQKQLLKLKEEQDIANKMTSPTSSPLDSAVHREFDVVSHSMVVPLSSHAESSPKNLSQGKHETSASNSSAQPALTESPKNMQDLLNAQATKVNGEEASKKTGINRVSNPTSQKVGIKAANHQKNVVAIQNEIGSSSLSSPQENLRSKKQKKDKQKLNNTEEWDIQPETVHPLPGWDSKPVEHPEDWECRSRPPIPANEQLQALESWARASESAFHESWTYIDTALPEFTLGTGVIYDGSLSTGLTDQAHFTRRLPNDPLTHARAEQTAQSKIEEHKAKIQEEAPEPQFTKQEQRQFRRAMRQRDIEFANLPNPYKPKADIYIRPAEARDLPQIAEIYNHYVKTSAVAYELDHLNEDTWRVRMADCRDEGYDMYVAVQKSGQGNGRNRRDNCEPVFGFAYGEDQNGKRSSCRFTALAQVYVSWKHLCIGVGRCLLDRVMAMLNMNHHLRQGVEWQGEPSFLRREIKKVLIEIPYWDDSEEERAIFKMEKNQTTGQMERVPGWKAKFLESVQFEYAGTIKEIGFKQGIMDLGKT